MGKQEALLCFLGPTGSGMHGAVTSCKHSTITAPTILAPQLTMTAIFARFSLPDICEGSTITFTATTVPFQVALYTCNVHSASRNGQS